VTTGAGARWAARAMLDASINHPKHYTSHPSGIECIEITRHMSFNLGNAVKYLWRFDKKGGVEDLQKAIWYINDEIERINRVENDQDGNSEKTTGTG